MQDFFRLKVWQKAHQLVLDVYKVARCLPREEMYGLTSQLRRSCVSVAANIAEGCGRRGDPDFARFLQIAMGSAKETQYCLLLARDLGFVCGDDHDRLSKGAIDVQRMLSSLLSRLRATS